MTRAIWPMLALAGSVAVWSAPASAESIMQQCGQQYQEAKAANTLNGMAWNQYRTECSARLKATPASVQTDAAPATSAVNPLKPVQAPTAVAPSPAVVPPPTTAAVTPAPVAPAATTTASGKTVSPGQAAFYARERQCGSEWRASKVTLIAQTPGLKWQSYLSQCNKRLKAAGQ